MIKFPTSPRLPGVPTQDISVCASEGKDLNPSKICETAEQLIPCSSSEIPTTCSNFDSTTNPDSIDHTLESKSFDKEILENETLTDHTISTTPKIIPKIEPFDDSDCSNQLKRDGEYDSMVPEIMIKSEPLEGFDCLEETNRKDNSVVSNLLTENQPLGNSDCSNQIKTNEECDSMVPEIMIKSEPLDGFDCLEEGNRKENSVVCNLLTENQTLNGRDCSKEVDNKGEDKVIDTIPYSSGAVKRSAEDVCEEVQNVVKKIKQEPSAEIEKFIQSIDIHQSLDDRAFSKERNYNGDDKLIDKIPNTLEREERSAEDMYICDAIQEGMKEIKVELNSEVENSIQSMASTSTIEFTPATFSNVHNKSELPSNNDSLIAMKNLNAHNESELPSNGESLMDTISSEMTSKEKSTSNDPEIETKSSLLNVQCCSGQVPTDEVEIVQEISNLSVPLKRSIEEICGSTEDVAKKIKVSEPKMENSKRISESPFGTIESTLIHNNQHYKSSESSHVLNDGSLIIMNSEDEYFDDINTTSESVVPNPDITNEKCGSALGNLHHEIVNKASGPARLINDSLQTGSVFSEDSSKLFQPPYSSLNLTPKSISNSESSVKCSVLKYFRLTSEIRSNELSECVKYLDKFYPQKDRFHLFFEKRKLYKQMKTPSLHSPELLNTLREKQMCNCTIPLNLQESTSKETDLSIEDLKKIIQAGSVSILKGIPSINLQSNKLTSSNTDAIQVNNVFDPIAIPNNDPISSELNTSSSPKEEAKLKPTAICGPILCSEPETAFQPTSITDISRDISNVVSIGQSDLFKDEVKAISLQLAAMSELLQSSQPTYSQFRSDNAQSAVQINANHSLESDDEVQILSVKQSAGNVTDSNSEVKDRFSENTSPLRTSTEVNCAPFSKPVIEKTQYSGTEPILFHDSTHSPDTDFENTSAQPSRSGISFSLSNEEVQVLAIKQGIVKESMHSLESTNTYSQNALVTSVSEKNLKFPSIASEAEILPTMAAETSEQGRSFDQIREEMDQSPITTTSASVNFSNAIPKVAEITNNYGQNSACTSESLENQENIIEKVCSIPIRDKEPNVESNENKNSGNSSSVDSGKKSGKIDESSENVSGHLTKIYESLATAQSNIENTESANRKNTQKKIIPTPIGTSTLMNKIYDKKLTISIASNRKRIVHEANTLSILPIPSITRKSQSNSEETSSSQDSSIHGTTSRTVLCTPSSKMQKKSNHLEDLNPTLETSKARIVQNETKDLNYASRTSETVLKGYEVKTNKNEIDLESQTDMKSSEAANRTVSFWERKGNRASLSKRSYKNVGKTFIENDDLPSLILEWNPSWLLTQIETKKCAPICDKYYHVKDCYEDELDYYNTYFPLHLLSIWLRISDSWKKNTLTYDCVIETEVELRNAVKVTCYTALSADRFAYWPRREDILLCKASKPGGGTKDLFGRICNVTYTDYESPGTYYDTSSKLKKVTFKFLCAETLDVPNLITVKVQILCNIRIPLLQNDALQHLNYVMKDLILNPSNHRYSINFISLYPRHHKAFPSCLQEIIGSITSSDIRVTVVNALVPWDNIFVTSQLAMALMKKNRPVLIGLKNLEALLDLAAVLKHFNLILAVKRKDVKLPNDYRRFTLDERFAILNRDVFSKCHVTLTLLSSIYMGDFSDAFAEQNLTCILPEAHLSTETESALLLYYDVKHLVLMGQSEHQANLHPVLKRFGYHISLFSRLYKAK